MNPQNAKINHESNNSTRNPHHILLSYPKDLTFHILFPNSQLQCTLYQKPQLLKFQFGNKSQEHKLYKNTHNFSTPNLEFWAKIGKKLGVPLFTTVLLQPSSQSVSQTPKFPSHSLKFRPPLYRQNFVLLSIGKITKL